MGFLEISSLAVCLFAFSATAYWSPTAHERPYADRPYQSPVYSPRYPGYAPNPSFPYAEYYENAPRAVDQRAGTVPGRRGGDGGDERTDRGNNMGNRMERRRPIARKVESFPNPADAIAFSGNRRTNQYFFQAGPVIFDDVTTNIGGGYNSDYGVFTAPESGIYFVSYNVVSPRKGAKTAAVDLLRNRKVVNSATGSGRSGETSNSAVLFLNRYDQISVQGRAESAIFCGEARRDAFCSFNVALLKIGHFTDSKVARPVPGW